MSIRTTFMNRYPDGSPRARIGFWRPDPADIEIIAGGFDPVHWGTRASTFIPYNSKDDLDVPIYAVEREPGFVEEHCLISGMKHCPLPNSIQHTGSDWTVDLTPLDRHANCHSKARHPMEIQYKVRVQECAKAHLLHRKNVLDEAGPYLTGEPDGRPVRSAAQQEGDRQKDYARRMGIGMIVPQENLLTFEEPAKKRLGTVRGWL